MKTKTKTKITKTKTKLKRKHMMPSVYSQQLDYLYGVLD